MQGATRKYISLNFTDLPEMNWAEATSSWENRKNAFDIWVGNLSKTSEDEIIMLRNELPFEKVAKEKRFKSTKGRSRYVLAHGMLQRIFQRYTGEKKVEIAFTKYNKPFLPKYPGLSFNMSHSGDRVLIAFRFDGVPVGVDIEQIKEGLDFELITEAFYHPKERNAILKGKDLNLFYKLWTRKEALLKAMEVGLTDEIRHINALDTQSGFVGRGVLEKFNNNSFYIKSFQLEENYFASLATLDNSLSYSFVNF